MKIIIQESRLFNTIYNFIEKNMKSENLMYSFGFNYEEDEYDINLIWFYFEEDEGENVLFEYIRKEYFDVIIAKREEEKLDNTIPKGWLAKSPLIEFRDHVFVRTMNGMFGKHWLQPFKKWFETNYPQFPINLITI